MADVVEHRAYLQLVRHDWDTGEHSLIGPRGPDVSYSMNTKTAEVELSSTEWWTPGPITTDGIGVVDPESGELLFVIPLHPSGGSTELREGDTVSVVPKVKPGTRCPACGASDVWLDRSD
jgi:hypothetical protein